MNEEFVVREEDIFMPDPELCVPVGVRDKETGNVGFMFFYNEEEVDRRLAVLGAMPEDDPYKEEADMIREFHRVRRAAWELKKDTVEIIPLPFLL